MKYDFCAVSGQIIEKAGKEYSFLIAIGKESFKDNRLFNKWLFFKKDS